MSVSGENLEAVVAEFEQLAQRRGLAELDLETAAPLLASHLRSFAADGDERTTAIDLLTTALDTFRAQPTLPNMLKRHPDRPGPHPADLADVIWMSLNCDQTDLRLMKR